MALLYYFSLLKILNYHLKRMKVFESSFDFSLTIFSLYYSLILLLLKSRPLFFFIILHPINNLCMTKSP